VQVPTWKIQTTLNTHKIKRGIEKSKDKMETYLRASFLYAVLISWSVASLDTDNTSYGSRRLAGVDGPPILEPIPISYPFSLFLFKRRAAPKVIKERPLCFKNSVICYSSIQLPQDSNSKAIRCSQWRRLHGIQSGIGSVVNWLLSSEDEKAEKLRGGIWDLSETVSEVNLKWRKGRQRKKDWDWVLNLQEEKEARLSLVGMASVWYVPLQDKVLSFIFISFFSLIGN